MNGSIYTGSSGLLSFQKALDAESNNIANVNTVGFKSDTISFSDLMYQDGIGKGVSMKDPLKNFGQGGMKKTDVNYDFAIKGDGFFTVSNPADTTVQYYTRAGNFDRSANSFLIDKNGLYVMGAVPVITGGPIPSKDTILVGESTYEDDTTVTSVNTFMSDFKKTVQDTGTFTITANSNLGRTISAGSTFIDGTRVFVDETSHSYTPNKDTYVDLQADGTFIYTEVEKDGTAPAIVDNNIRVAKVSTNDNQVISATSFPTGTSGMNYKTAITNINDIENLKAHYQSALNLYAKNMQPGDTASTQKDTIQFDIPTVETSDTKYNLEVTINGNKYQQNFDTSVQNTLNLLSDKINITTGVISSVDAAGLLTINAIVPGQKLTISDVKLNDKKVTVLNQSVASGSGQNLVDAIYKQLESVLKANGSEISQTKSVIAKTATNSSPELGKIGLDLYDLGILELDPNSLSKNIFGDLTNDNGNIYLKNGDSKYLIGRLEAVSFADNSALKPEGHNLYTRTADSGEPLYLKGSADIINNYLELSTEDLSEGLTNLMVWQKAFEANSKAVTTSDELLKTALALKPR